MDRVRFGRALGYGARHFGRTLAQAANAAAAAPPERARGTGPAAGNPGAPAAVPRPMPPAPRSRPQSRKRSFDRAQTGKLGKSLWGPLAKFSSVLWLQVTGVFFALIALFVGSGAWKLRSAAHLPYNSPAAHKFYLHVAVFATFFYFAVSSFLRARRRERG